MARDAPGAEPLRGFRPLIAIIAVAAFVCAASLVAWNWYLEQRRWERTHQAEARDKALAELSPRMMALEEKVNNAEWSRALKR